MRYLYDRIYDMHDKFLYNSVKQFLFLYQCLILGLRLNVPCFFFGDLRLKTSLTFQSFTTSCNKKIASSMLENFPKYLSLFSC